MANKPVIESLLPADVAVDPLNRKIDERQSAGIKGDPFPAPDENNFAGEYVKGRGVFVISYDHLEEDMANIAEENHPLSENMRKAIIQNSYNSLTSFFTRLGVKTTTSKLKFGHPTLIPNGIESSDVAVFYVPNDYLDVLEQNSTLPEARVTGKNLKNNVPILKMGVFELSETINIGNKSPIIIAEEPLSYLTEESEAALKIIEKKFNLNREELNTIQVLLITRHELAHKFYTLPNSFNGIEEGLTVLLEICSGDTRFANLSLELTEAIEHPQYREVFEAIVNITLAVVNSGKKIGDMLASFTQGSAVEIKNFIRDLSDVETAFEVIDYAGIERSAELLKVSEKILTATKPQNTETEKINLEEKVRLLMQQIKQEMGKEIEE